MLCCRGIFCSLVACFSLVVVSLVVGIEESVWLFPVVVDKMGTAILVDVLLTWWLALSGSHSWLNLVSVLVLVCLK